MPLFYLAAMDQIYDQTAKQEQDQTDHYIEQKSLDPSQTHEKMLGSVEFIIHDRSRRILMNYPQPTIVGWSFYAGTFPCQFL